VAASTDPNGHDPMTDLNPGEPVNQSCPHDLRSRHAAASYSSP